MKISNYTKLILNILLIFLLVGLTQCKKDSTSNTNTTVSIVGKWQLASSTYIKYTKGVITKTGTDDIKLVGYTILFKNDGTAVSTDNSGTVEYYNYKLTGNLLQLTLNNTPLLGSSSIPIILTSTKLEWTFFSQGNKDNGTEVTDSHNRIN
jgi:hypothetical protein